VLYLDGASGDTLIRDDQEQVAEYLTRFETMRQQAVMGDEAIEFVARLADVSVDGGGGGDVDGAGGGDGTLNIAGRE